MIPDILSESRLTFDLKGNLFHGPAIHSIVFNENANNYNPLYFLALLNSKLIWFFISNTSTALRGNFYRLIPEFLEPIPIKTIDFKNKNEKDAHDTIVKAVENLLQLNQQLGQATQTTQKNAISRAIADLETSIDRTVYQLYDLDEAEINIIEKPNLKP
jgi:adenine-specific DNA-methyltransferase